jgi:ubiquinone/menaquinone biosynthesis C-methylase UbiE
MRLLDVVCGPGYVSEAAEARGAEPVGVDVAEAMIELARRRLPDLEFVVGDAQRLPLADRSFDVVTMNFGILHLAEPTRAIAEPRSSTTSRATQTTAASRCRSSRE